MRVPDYGGGNWAEKHRGNESLPYVRDIGMKDSLIFIKLSEPADSISFTGQGHSQLSKVTDSYFLAYVFRPDDN